MGLKYDTFLTISLPVDALKSTLVILKCSPSRFHLKSSQNIRHFMRHCFAKTQSRKETAPIRSLCATPEKEALKLVLWQPQCGEVRGEVR